MDDRDKRLAVANEECDLRTWSYLEAEKQAERARVCRTRDEPVTSAEHAATLDSYACFLRRVSGLQLMAETLLRGLDGE